MMTGNVGGPEKLYLSECYHTECQRTAESINSFSNLDHVYSCISPKKKKVFMIKKFLKYDKIMNEISKISVKSQKKKIHFISINRNTSKLNDIQKLRHLKLLSKLIRRERRKYNIMSMKIDKTMEKIFKKRLNKNRFGNKRDKRTEIRITLKNLIQGLKRARENQFLNFSNEKNIIEEFIDLIAKERLKPHSLHFKIICTQIRMLLKESEIKHISNKNQQFIVSLPDRKIPITQKEHQRYKRVIKDFQVANALFGVNDLEKEFNYEFFQNGVRTFKEFDNSEFNDIHLFNDFNQNGGEGLVFDQSIEYFKSI